MSMGEERVKGEGDAMVIPIRVLLVEDSAQDAELALCALREEGYDPAAQRVDTPDAMANALETQEWDVIIADYVLPSFSGLDALRLVQHKELDIPLIIVSGNIGEDVAVDAVRAGARDYVLKSYLKRLAPAVKREIEEAKLRCRIMEAKQHAEEALRTAHDQLEQCVENRTEELRETNALLNCEIAEHIKVAAELRLLSTAVESAANGIVITDREGSIIWCNPALTRMTGYTREEAIGQNPRLFKSGLQPLEFYETLWATICGGQPWHGQLVNRRKDGTHYTEELTITPVRAGGNDDITHFVAIKEDISARKQAEQEREQLLEEVQRRAAALDATFDAVLDPMISFNEQAIVSHTNPAMRSLLGCDPQGMTHMEYAGVLKIRFPDGHALHAEEFPSHRALHGEVVVSERFIITRADGQERVLQISATPIETDGHCWGSVAIGHDVTELEQLFNELQRRVAELDATLASMADGLIIYSPAGEILLDNPAARNLLDGILVEEEYGELPRWLSRHAWNLDGKQLTAENVPGALAARGETVTGEVLIFRRKDGTEVYTSVTAAPIRQQDNSIIGVVCTYTDITQLHQLQEQREVYIHTIYHDLGRRSRLSMVMPTSCVRSCSNRELMACSRPALPPFSRVSCV